jgi:hypothetical protein
VCDQKLLVLPLPKQRTKGAAGEVVCVLGELLVLLLYYLYCCSNCDSTLVACDD